MTEINLSSIILSHGHAKGSSEKHVPYRSIQLYGQYIDRKKRSRHIQTNIKTSEYRIGISETAYHEAIYDGKKCHRESNDRNKPGTERAREKTTRHTKQDGMRDKSQQDDDNNNH